MAFIRKRGHTYYLVHSVRDHGRVRQLYLARLGRRPRINDKVIKSVVSKHPLVRLDWKELKHKVSRELVRSPSASVDSLRDLLAAIREFHLEIADLHPPVFEVAADRVLRSEFTAELRLLRGTLDMKLNQFRKRGSYRLGT